MLERDAIVRRECGERRKKHQRVQSPAADGP